MAKLTMADIYGRMSKDEPFIKLYKYTLLLPRDLSVMLSYLISMDTLARMGYLNRLDDDPNFFECCKEGFISKTLVGWSVYAIEESINKLINEGYIYKRSIRDGLKQSTYIKLEPMKINSLIDEYYEKSAEDKEKSIAKRFAD